MYRIREAGIADFSKIAGIHNDSANFHILIEQGKLDQTYYNEIISGKLTKIYLVEKSGELAGFILFHINPEERNLFIERFSIQEEYVKKGVSDHLHQKVIRFAERQRMKQVMAKITTDNPVVRTFFEEKDWHPGGQTAMFIRNL